MKKLWLLISVLLVWFLSSKNRIEPLIESATKRHSSASKLGKETSRGKRDQTMVSSVSNQWGIQSYHEIQTESFDSPMGKTRIYSFSQDGVPIIGMTIRLKEQADGSLIEEENTYRAISRVPIHRGNLEAKAEQLKTNDGRYDLTGLTPDSIVILVRDGLEEGELAFATSAVDKARPGVPTQLLIRSDDGKILRKSFGRKEF